MELKADSDHGPKVTEPRDEFVDHWKAGAELSGKLGFEKAQLDLLARRAVRDVAAELVQAHGTPRFASARRRRGCHA